MRLKDLFVEVERAWVGRRDAGAAQLLAMKHPEHRAELLDFLVDLMASEMEGPDPELVEAEDRVHEWLMGLLSDPFRLSEALESGALQSGEVTSPKGTGPTQSA